ncbi:EamA family transporter [Microbacterium betulae]|uniref:EamA family transporter n=1 Tax=Microbacterium betulae TaxID=2981139 RepID=A0AA97FHA0_9MICO|nr:EamA family transporter [Microbacterium sp. AB]WOF22653.1 EamA family transporter [Microbacterium sp. AB]
MDTALSRQAPAPGTPLSPDTATPRQRTGGVAVMLASGASNQFGAAAGALAFPAIGAFGVVAIRQIVAAVALSALARPRFRALDRAAWALVAGLAVTFGAMNITLYSAVDRLGLGTAVTLEFLGPLAVAVVTSRRARDVAGAAVAALGVLVLTQPQPTSDIAGLGLGLASAFAWAAYILLNRALGSRLSGLRAASAASVLSAIAWAVPAVVWFSVHPPSLRAVGLAVVCGLLSSAVPYAADLVTLRRVPTSLFGTFMSINPVWAATAGWLVLGQALAVNEWIGMGLVVIANVVVTAAGLGRPGAPPRATAAPPSDAGPASDEHNAGESRRSGRGRRGMTGLLP